MSATLNAGRFADFFGGKVFRIPGRTFPVEIVTLGAVGPTDMRSDKYITECVTAAVEIHCTKPPGDILVFLTGQAEISAAARRLFKLSEELDYNTDVKSRDVDGLLILPMYVASACIPCSSTTTSFYFFALCMGYQRESTSTLNHLFTSHTCCCCSKVQLGTCLHRQIPCEFMLIFLHRLLPKSVL